MLSPHTVPSIAPIEDGEKWLVQPFGSLHPQRGQAIAEGSREAAEAKASALSLEHALRGHEFESMVLEIVTELEKPGAVVADPYGMAQRLRTLRMRKLAEIKEAVAGWEANP